MSLMIKCADVKDQFEFGSVQRRCFQNTLRTSFGRVFFPCGQTEHATLCSDASDPKLSVVVVYPAETELGRLAVRDSSAGQ